MNPASLASAALVLGGAFLPWMGIATFAVYGNLAFPVFGVQAGLWDLAGSAAPVAVAAAVPMATVLLLLAGALAVPRWPILGAALTGVAALVFGLGTWGLFGAHFSGATATVVVPGPGIAWAGIGVAAAIASRRFAERPLNELVGTLRTPPGMAALGLSMAVAFLLIDGIDHGAGGNPVAFLGAGILENVLHVALVGSVAILLLVRVKRIRAFEGRAGSVLIALAGVGLLVDAVYHLGHAETDEFVGHSVPELITHAATYYGVVLLVISRFFV